MDYKKVVISKYGGPDVLKVVEENNLPEPEQNEIRVKVLVTSAAFTDTLLRMGKYPAVKDKPPFSPGYDMVGKVDKCGADVKTFSVGDKVAALTVFGAYSEYMCINQERLLPVPKDLDSSEVVSLPLTYITAYQMMHRAAKIQKGKSILIHGAGGAVGTALLQLGKLLDLKMYGTGSKSKQELINKMGAVAIDYQSEDFVEKIKTLTGSGVDFVIDGIGGDYLKRSFSVLKPGGILVAYGFQKAVTGNGSMLSVVLDFIKLSLWNLLPNKKSTTFYSITGMQKKHPDWFKEDFNSLLELLRQRKIAPVISYKLPLTDAVKAHELLDKATVEGKIVLTVAEE
ncbi:MAG: medium chain dehydrogenase/reductase family protein [bacterium]